jgi:hypothetical protein
VPVLLEGFLDGSDRMRPGIDELDDVLSVAVARLRLAAPGGTILS